MRIRRFTPCRPVGLFVCLLFLQAPTTPSKAAETKLACRPLPEVVEGLRRQGTRIEVEDGLLSSSMLVRGEPSPGPTHELLAKIVEPYGLQVERHDGSLSVTPGAGLDASDLERLRRLAGPVLERETLVDVLPRLFGRDDLGRSILEVDFPGELPWLEGPRDDPRFVIVRVDDAVFDDARAPYELKQRIVDTAARLQRARFALEASSETLARLVDQELAPYVDAFLPTDDGPPPAIDPTGRLWWRTERRDRPLLDVLIEGANRGVALVLITDAVPSSAEERLVERIRGLSVGVLEHQPALESTGAVAPTFFLDPRTGRYYLAIAAPGRRAERLSFSLEPIGEIETLLPPDARPVTEIYGSRVSLQLDGSGGYWLFELTPGTPPTGVDRALVEGDVLVDPYEVVVQNQIFQRREEEKVLSLDVMEYATIVPHWREGVRSTWEHRILRRRGWLDEYLHLNLWRDGVRVPRDKLYKGMLNRPIDRIEMEPLTVENRKTYRYTYLGQDEIDGRPTWKIGFEPVVEGRLVSGAVWIDQRTGAHRRIRTRHQALGVGVLGGDFTTDFGWVADGDQCFWDWRERRGTEIVDSLDSSGSYSITYERRDFRFNRPDIDEEIRGIHDSDVLIHVATPPEGHRWLLRGDELKEKRGDRPYRRVGVLREEDLENLREEDLENLREEDLENLREDDLENLREEDLEDLRQEDPEDLREEDLPFRASGDCDASSVSTDSDGGSAETTQREAAEASTRLAKTAPTPPARDEVLAGLYAFPSRSRISVGLSGGTGDTTTTELLGFNYVDLDFLNRGRRGKGELYLWIGGFEDDGLVSVTDPQLGGSRWSLTTSFDIRFDPEEDFLFREIEPEAPGDESSFRNLSLDTERTSLRFSLGRVIGGRWTTRLRYGYSLLRFDRKPGTDPTFVVPLDTPEHQLAFDLTYSARRFEASWSALVGRRESWRSWGIGGEQPSEPSYSRGSLRLTTAAPISTSQSWSATLGLFGGADQDRFSRARLFQVGARVPGYSSSIGFDRGAHVALSYNFRIWRLPLRLRVDGASLRADAKRTEAGLDQELAGAQLNLDLHGPFETDLLFGIGRGIHAEPDRGREETYYWMLVSRRFGGG